MRFLAEFLGLGRPTALAIFAFSSQLAKVFRASLGDLLPTLPSKLDGGVFPFCQNSKGLAFSPAPYYASHGNDRGGFCFSLSGVVEHGRKTRGSEARR